MAFLKDAGIAAATGGLGLAASKLFGKKKVPAFDISGAQNIVNAGGEEQRRIIAQGRPETKKLTDQFGNEINTAQEEAKTAGRESANEFLQNFDPVQSRLIQQRQDQLKRQYLGALPDALQAQREALAATGGLQTGAASDVMGQTVNKQLQGLGEAQSSLEQTALEQQLAARSKIFDAQNQMTLQNLGIDANTAQAILNTGDQALINELNALIDESTGRTGALANLELTRQGANVAAAQNEANNRQALINSLIGAGGTIAGAYMGGPAVAATTSNATEIAKKRRGIVSNSAVAGEAA